VEVGLAPRRHGRLATGCLPDPEPHEASLPTHSSRARLRPLRRPRLGRAAPPAPRSRPRRERRRPRPPQGRGLGARPLGLRAPGRRGQRRLRSALARPGRARGTVQRDAWRGRAERDRAGAVRRARRPAHGGADGNAPLRRGRAVLRPCLRVRLLLQRGGDVREVGPGGDPRRRRAGPPRLSSRRGRDAASRRGGGRPAPPGGGPPRPRGLPRRRGPGPLPGPAPRGAPPVAGPQDLPGLGRRHRGRVRLGPCPDGGLRPGAGDDVAAARQPRPSDAPVPGHGPAHGRPRPGREPLPPARRRAEGRRPRDGHPRRRRHLAHRPRPVRAGRRPRRRPRRPAGEGLGGPVRVRRPKPRGGGARAGRGAHGRAVAPRRAREPRGRSHRPRGGGRPAPRGGGDVETPARARARARGLRRRRAS
jgi:hypothetical protein